MTIIREAATGSRADTDHAARNGSTGPERDTLLRQLVKALRASGVRYCRWKGGLGDDRVLTGESDLDLLVDRKDSAKFLSVVTQLGLKRAVSFLHPHLSGVIHLYGRDQATGSLIHLHVNFLLVIGESFLKNYRLPLEELVLQNTRPAEGPGEFEGMPVVEPAAELITFVLRVMLKCSSLTECLLLSGTKETLRAKLRTVLTDDAAARSGDLLARWLPGIPPSLFFECVESLRDGVAWLRRFRIARRLRSRLRPYCRFSSVGEKVSRMSVWVRAVWGRLVHGRGNPKVLATGGAVIAFVGPEACGKSTLAEETRKWLGKVFRVTSAHLGKPPSTWLTLLPNGVGRLLRLAVPRLRAGDKPEGAAGAGSGGLVHAVRAVLLAWDRRALAVRLARKAASGWLVVCDRYSSPAVGAADGVRLGTTDGGGVRGYLARLESRLYRDIPPPDIVLQLTAPTAVAVERNKVREKVDKESETYVRRRHGSFTAPHFVNARTVEVDTNRPVAETVETLRRVLWELL